MQRNGGVEEMSSAPAREAPLLENGGESKAITWSCVARKGKRWAGKKQVGNEELDENDVMSEASFATAESQGHRTEEEDTLTFEVSMVQLGWQNEELVSDRWVKVADQPEVRVTQLTKQEERLEREDEECSRVGDRGKGHEDRVLRHRVAD